MSAKQARRQAFYGRQRIARRLRRLLLASMEHHRQLIDNAMLSCITTGVGWIEVLRAQDDSFFDCLSVAADSVQIVNRQ